MIKMPENKKKPKKFPWVMPEMCEGCGECATACEFDAMEMVPRLKFGGKTECSWVTNTENCIGCGKCAKACVWAAVQMTEYVDDAIARYLDPEQHP